MVGRGWPEDGAGRERQTDSRVRGRQWDMGGMRQKQTRGNRVDSQEERFFPHTKMGKEAEMRGTTNGGLSSEMTSLRGVIFHLLSYGAGLGLGVGYWG